MSESVFSAAQQQASTLYLPPGPWATVLDCLCAKFTAISREQWLDRIARNRVLDADGKTITPDMAYREGLKIHYFREVPNETPIPVVETILYADEHLVVADKPHFLPVTPAGEYVEQTLLRRLIHRLDNPNLVPLHRIDRHTAGLVLFSANRQTRSAYQTLFPTRRIDKCYEAIAPALPELEFPRLHESRLVEGEPFFRMQEGPGVSNTQTRIEVLERHGPLWRYGLHPVTGKKHQLRVHMAALGAAICNDPFYPDALKDPLDDYQHPLKLLAKSLRFIDPLSGEPRQFESLLKLDW
ncbi:MULTISPECIES: pseudouridine synthase [Pseudomonas syringae group]|uniref:Pseudouridine synthase n=4 Tax=Pseudomonas syringae group TaxID=136849 RepID=A0AAD0GQZ5_9PSED|nr:MULTISPECIES: pseudouridine synthase [Pseudomonas syringae group]AVB20827.1 pseudouridine synthase [Pseudomonas avellanae]EGH10904.1 pseudouridine synthase [Pseudomonas amygdali pv. morsprunorum str. M302280]KWS67794.1 pseudouridine synthase [Pseudomonas amygdali pv. morsprunorum]PHN48733.1 pseudouridine synthase [Pseudomonas avellanae]POC93442.1 pseudouridine synthase [Pseudomonas avellanae]